MFSCELERGYFLKTQIVSFHCVLRDRLGTLLSSTYNQEVMTYPEELHEEEKGVLQGLAKALKNLKKGQRKKISLSAEEAYGFYDPKLLIETSRSELPGGHDLQIGDQIQIESAPEEFRLYRVVHTTKSRITLDANHPLAGQDLVFHIEATEVREATLDEISETLDHGQTENLYH